MKAPLFKILKKGNPTAVFVGGERVSKACLEALRSSFYFVAGSGKPVTVEFPYTLEPVNQ